MSEIERYLLTPGDHSLLEVMLERRRGFDDPLVALITRKLSKAVIVSRDDIAPTVVTLNSRVSFRVDANPAQTRILAHDEMRGAVGMTLPLTTRRGLALLGLSEGQSVSVEREGGGGTEVLRVLEVVYQPESAGREASQLRPRTTGAASALRLVHSADAPGLAPAGRSFIGAETDFDDPGPSAA